MQTKKPSSKKPDPYKRMFYRISALYQFFFLQESNEEFVKRIYEGGFLFDNEVKQLEEIVTNLPKLKNKILDSIEAKWSWDRIMTLDKAILVYGAAEYLISGFDAPKVIFAAVEIAKKYSDEESFRFVNAVLDKLCKNNPRGTKKTA